ncbi:MAG: RimK family alpha-L-glutamate ligase [Steroidobacteraceae bacterium]
MAGLAVSVLLWGSHEDSVVAAVASALARMGTAVAVVDGSNIESVDVDGDLTTATGERLRLSDISGVLVRPSDTTEPCSYAALAAWTELTSAVVLNRLSAGASNRSKPYQLRLLREAGFKTPDTLVTTDPDDVRAFRAEHGQLIYKSTSGVRSIVTLLKASDEKRIEDVRTCPTQFQQFVAGIDHRVHVVGREVFATHIETGAVDYRYATPADRPTRMHSVTLPEDVGRKCIAVAKALGLGLAGIDLRVDAEGHWWCFEVNTSPGFIWFEQQTAQPIAAAVARMLTRREACAYSGCGCPRSFGQLHWNRDWC